MNLHDKVAVVTGGGTGLGKAISLELAKMGAKVVIISRKEENLKTAVHEINSKFNHSSAYFVGNIREPEQMKNIADKIVNKYGRIDILVNNAGGQFPSKAKDISVNGWKSVIDLNLNAYFYTSKFFGEKMIQQKSGNIVNMAAITAIKGTNMFAHASAARSGTIRLTETLALEWAPYGIRVNAIAPGLIETKGLEEEFKNKNELEQMLAKIPMNRFGKPEEVSKVVGFLVSDASSYITGQTLIIDGGSMLSGGIL